MLDQAATRLQWLLLILVNNSFSIRLKTFFDLLRGMKYRARMVSLILETKVKYMPANGLPSICRR